MDAKGILRTFTTALAFDIDMTAVYGMAKDDKVGFIRFYQVDGEEEIKPR